MSEQHGQSEEAVGDLDRAANVLAGWLLDRVHDLDVHQYMTEIHPDDWKAAAECAIRAARGEFDARPFTVCPDLSR